ncbi:hypothetical protein Syun_002819 [Stephania yunnanensis]|uniref:E3 ubiquitin-protein ligase CHIP n=1 Tax=Stephania yunnanensis TaxID=152371 RepID=A0AAP0PZ95_9MAGN
MNSSNSSSRERERGMSTTVSFTESSYAKQAEQLKRDGNTYFNKQRFGAAIDAYTEAHYMLGLALLQMKDYAEGVKELEKALELGIGAKHKGCALEEIWLELAKAKYTEWERQSSERSWKLQRLKETCEKALEMQYALDASNADGANDEDANAYQEHFESLGEVFAKALKDDTPTEIPDYLCCKITLDILRDPVITPSGVTYERAALLDHFQKLGKYDPVTREPLDEHHLVPNLAIKEAVQAFLEEHGWAYKID